MAALNIMVHGRWLNLFCMSLLLFQEKGSCFLSVLLLNKQTISTMRTLLSGSLNNAKTIADSEVHGIIHLVALSIMTEGGKSIDHFKSFALSQSAVMDNKTYENHSYYPTQDVNRSKFCICYGDFNADKEIDMAIVLDNPENQTSKFMILCTNTTNKLPYLAYETGYDEYVKIATIKKGTVVQEQQESESESEGESNPEPAQEVTSKILQLDGVYVKNELINHLILYSMESNKFSSVPISK
jgi:hypothetical protein